MGISDPPYLYDSPSRRQVAYPYSDFDPKAATRASWDRATLASQPRPKQEGPLIDFNKHPDSYMIVQGLQIEHKQLPKYTKAAVKWIRWAQFALRLMQLLGATGALICVICVKNVQAVQGWIMRVPPAYDMLLSLYGVYHLVRPAKGRTPGSSASYHLFAMFMDGCLIPFYIFIALMANQNWIAPATNEDRWTSFFASDWSTTQLLFATFLVAAVTGGLHVVSVAIDIYLIVVFRKIGKLPPDMNPLEENLTSRRPARHQYKSSDASGSTMSMAQKPGYMSGSTLNVNDARMSKASLDDRTVPFRHSRMGSELTFSPHNPQSARLSRQQFDLYQQNPSNSGSNQSFSHHTRAGSANAPDRGSFIVPNAAPTDAIVKSQQQTGLMQDNWYEMEESERHNPISPPSRLSTPGRSVKTGPNFSHPSPELSPEPEHRSDRQPRLPTLIPAKKSKDSFTHQPLGMNPPTPSIEQQEVRALAARRRSQLATFEDSDDEENESSNLVNDGRLKDTVDERMPLNEVAVNRSITAASRLTTATEASSVYSESAPSLETAAKQQSTRTVTSAATPKLRQYGDLAAATRGIRNTNAGYAPLNQGSPQPRNGVNEQGPRAYGTPTPSPPKHAGYGHTSGRVVSRSGADIADESLYLPQMNGRRRLVSGKAAEEGMAGGRW